MKTALHQYQRLEAEALWRASPDARRVDVIVSIGQSSLIIKDYQERALAHWSIAAVERQNPGQFPAIYAPDGDPGEILEISEEETEMVAAIEKLRRTVALRRPKSGRGRKVSLIAILAISLGLGVFWMPQAIREYAFDVVPQVTQRDVGTRVLMEMSAFSGKPCASPIADPALRRLTARLGLPEGSITISPDLTQAIIPIPGQYFAANRTLVEDFEDPDVLAGYVLSAQAANVLTPPFKILLDHLSLFDVFRLLATGQVPSEALSEFAQDHLLTTTKLAPAQDIIAAFDAAELRLSAFAYAVDVTGETTIDLIEADQTAKPTRPSLGDQDWIRLQGICGG